MMRTELDAAGITEPELRRSYRICRELNARHGKTFFLATRLLAPDQRPAVHALYGFARRADDILDDFRPQLSTTERAARLNALARQFEAGDTGGDPVLAAVLHTAQTYRIPGHLFSAFLASMRLDLSVTDYPDRAALDRYVYGSAEVIGLQLLPVLGATDTAAAAPYAAALGKAFQLTNFLRDVDEDLARDRVYLPADELAAHGVDRELLLWCRRHRRGEPRVRRALAAQHAITRKIYAHAREGIALLAPRSRPCVTTAATLYAEILDRIEAADFEVFGRRARVGTGRRLQVGAAGQLRAWWARRPAGPTRPNTPRAAAHDSVSPLDSTDSREPT
ncbi:phytoene/squalene synthase family protein [Nocardia implantans]|uniref:Phytoene/squalene synthase family protein n=1 Tax=Nocardia implantans TaxID=3108168 RepID=A0ABU6AWQ1_9NOCA|nr:MULTISPECIES: phytoene/squalene synthase family protein [unclassified Nocardia]MBF6193928.1 phytoene/squalene synthase family protein [Nocardia beijingensis]MEA3529333.1 phytoene/squalene synthase family protein [Nocardia sp. CDC192]MEB3511919.1 phytoene/squalene synthase family protein [Nocardia sp. CDC186]